MNRFLKPSKYKFRIAIIGFFNSNSGVFMEYEQMLDRLYLSLPQQSLNKERFEMPRAESFIQGTKTTIKNFTGILKAVNRDNDQAKRHLSKYLARETATAANIEENKLVLSGKFSENQVNDLLKSYIEQFVLCPVCKKPDTHVIEKQGVKILKCEACGAISSVKGL